MEGHRNMNSSVFISHCVKWHLHYHAITDAEMSKLFYATSLWYFPFPVSHSFAFFIHIALTHVTWLLRCERAGMKTVTKLCSPSHRLSSHFSSQQPAAFLNHSHSSPHYLFQPEQAAAFSCKAPTGSVQHFPVTERSIYQLTGQGFLCRHSMKEEQMLETARQIDMLRSAYIFSSKG